MNDEMLLYQKKFKDNIQLLINQSRLAEAKDLLKEYEQIVRDDIEIYSIRAVIAIIEGNLDLAEKILIEGLKIDSKNYDLLYNLAYLYRLINNSGGAIRLYEKILDLDITADQRKEIKDYLSELKEMKNSSNTIEVTAKKKIEHRKKLNVGCGRNILEGWINLDLADLPGVDIVADLDDCKNNSLPLDDNSIEEFYLSHVIEHINNPLPMMQELHRIAVPTAKAIIKCPYGSNDDAFEDPTHVKQYFINSFGYFSQPFYWRADYGYRGDWLTEKIILLVDKNKYAGKSAEEIFEDINTKRNVVKEMIAELRAIKPIREPKKELQVPPKIEISLC